MAPHPARPGARSDRTGGRRAWPWGRTALAALFAALLGGCPRRAPAAEHAPPTRATEASDAGPEAVELTPAQLVAADLRTTRVTPEALAPRLSAVATIVSDPAHLARVGPRVAGRVTAVYVTLGALVHRGDPLFGIDTVEFHDTSREYFQARARARAAQEGLDRAQRLLAAGAGSVAEVEHARASVGVESAALHEAEEHLHVLGLTERDIRRLADRTTHGETHSRVLAPIDGRVVALELTLGQVVSGTEDLVTITDPDPVWALLQVYERDLAHVGMGTAVEVTVPTYPERVFRGAVTFVGGLVAPATHTVEARARIDNADGALRPGMTATAAIQLAAGAPSIVLPAEAVQRVEGRRVVFVRVAERRFELRTVRAGTEEGGRIPVLAGVAPGDDVVTTGAFTLRGEHERAGLEED